MLKTLIDSMMNSFSSQISMISTTTFRYTHLEYFVINFCLCFIDAHFFLHGFLIFLIMNLYVLEKIIKNDIFQILMQAVKVVTNTVVMIRPFNFRSNQMTAQNNHYQQHGNHNNDEEIHLKSLQQFDNFHTLLVNAGIKVIVVQDQGKNNTPDSIFPNNWVSFQNQGGFILYPMYAANRRLERQINIFQEIINQNQIIPRLLHDYSHYQNVNVFLEGTGSMVLDKKDKIAYAALSPRTNEKLFLQFCQENGYKPCVFKAYQNVNGKRQLIYHTNVMMWIGEGVVFICLKSIDDEKQRENVIRSIKESKKDIVELYQEQIDNFAGNCLMLEKGKEERLVIMSKRAYQAYNKEQIERIKSFGEILHCDLQTIQKYGGGSARCMLAEIF